MSSPFKIVSQKEEEPFGFVQPPSSEQTSPSPAQSPFPSPFTPKKSSASPSSPFSVAPDPQTASIPSASPPVQTPKESIFHVSDRPSPTPSPFTISEPIGQPPPTTAPPIVQAPRPSRAAHPQTGTVPAFVARQEAASTSPPASLFSGNRSTTSEVPDTASPPAGNTMFTKAPIQPSPVVPNRQVELRAIFGVDHNMRPEEILEKSHTLYGVAKVTPLEREGVSALNALKDSMVRIGFTDMADQLSLSTGNNGVDFITSGQTIFAVLHEGKFIPGVRESLAIAAYEYDQFY